MKFFFKLSLIAILGIGIFSSCAKKNDATSTTTSSMSATIGGAAWTATTVTGTNSGGTLAIGGYISTSSKISIQLLTNTAAGTYSITPYEFDYIIGYSAGGSTSIMQSGTLVINSNAGNIIKGTFSGTLTDTQTMNTTTCTNGAFTVKYQ